MRARSGVSGSWTSEKCSLNFESTASVRAWISMQGSKRMLGDFLPPPVKEGVERCQWP